MKYTVFVVEDDRYSTTYITAVEATDVEEAKAQGLGECAVDWGRESTEGLMVLGVLAGDVEVIEWDDEV